LERGWGEAFRRPQQKLPKPYIRHIPTISGWYTLHCCNSFASSNPRQTTMSTKRLIIALAVAVTLMIVCPMAFAESSPETSEKVTFTESFLDLSGVMTVDSLKVNDYSVYIFQDGSPSDTFHVNTKLEQHYMLPIGHQYALKFCKHGYKDRIVLVDAHVNAKHVRDLYSFRYAIEFVDLEESNTFDDFPVAYIHFDQEQKDFDYSRTYSNNVRLDKKQPQETVISKSWH
jgi:hypothetical protein